MRNHLLLFTIVTILFASCIPQSKLEYFQEDGNSQSEINEYTINASRPNIIKPNDELFIKVSSFDDLNFNYFQTGQETNNQIGTEISLSIVSYQVNEEGMVYFPIIGNVHMADLNLEQATSKLTLLLNSYFDQPNVIIKFAYKKISLLGEVARPGYYTYSKEQLTVLEALALAGDLNVHGDRKGIYLIRNVDDKVVKVPLDITDDSIILSDYYYVKADDIIYVKPRKSLKWSVVATPISLVLSTITTAFLTLNYFGFGANNN